MAIDPDHPSGSTTFSTLVRVVFKVLEHENIRACLVGEVALNYYNVPAVDVEIAVPTALFQDAAASLRNCGGLFETCDYDSKEFTVHTEYKRGFPRFTATGWASPNISIIFFPASLCGLEPLEACSIREPHTTSPDTVFGSEILDNMAPADVEALCFPSLRPFFIGLLRQYLDAENDMAMVGAEHLVDGMDLDGDWCDENLVDAAADVVEWARRLVKGKQSRIAYYQDNQVTCFIMDQQQAARLRKIPGF